MNPAVVTRQATCVVPNDLRRRLAAYPTAIIERTQYVSIAVFGASGSR
jgi:hypothetical protein